MASLSSIAQVLFWVFGLGLCLWGIKIGLSYYFFAKKKEEINALEAKMAVLKMHLKGKIKKKWNLLEQGLLKEKAVDTLEIIKPMMTTLCNYSFSKPEDYQNTVKKLSEVTSVVLDFVERKRRRNSFKPKTEDTADEIEDFKLTPEQKTAKYLVKYDLANMLIISEVLDTNEKLMEKIKEYNDLSELEKNKKKILMPSKIEIENFGEVVIYLNRAKTEAEQGNKKIENDSLSTPFEKAS